MFIRKGFVTNSSSTSFIGWGMPVRPNVLENGIEALYPDRFETVLEEIGENGGAVIVMHCSESGWNYLIVSASLEAMDDGPWYARLRETYPVDSWWPTELEAWCKEHGIEYSDPHWIFASVF
jgi:hypothetical protein